MPHPNPHHRPPIPGGPEWLYAARESYFTVSEYANLLRSIADALDASGRIDIDSTIVEMPEAFEFDLRFERTPHNSRALLIRAEWPEDNVRSSAQGSARGLRVRPVIDGGAA